MTDDNTAHRVTALSVAAASFSPHEFASRAPKVQPARGRQPASVLEMWDAFVDQGQRTNPCCSPACGWAQGFDVS